MRFRLLRLVAEVAMLACVLTYSGAALARTPYRSNPPASPPATSYASASPAASTIAPAACADGLCQKPAAGLSELATGEPLTPDHRYGTALEWVDTPQAAGKEAAQQKKLVFLIQISGNFTRQEFT